ncbi:unnamed protein product [marine sediment metagenome]|uniref:Uncharacterized protein n=1 Tax=marine sediment metagenome TaxID=412755 RepID=X1BL42_9ZZZZ
MPVWLTANLRKLRELEARVGELEDSFVHAEPGILELRERVADLESLALKCNPDLLGRVSALEAEMTQVYEQHDWAPSEPATYPGEK